ncbi:hypothetical protein HPB47_024460 [Ixodes persulcatus]|uniref:Uncharacterized protein n=1 Tax=Ixodes persulcatus TaxID=34615 RepID=A0AC60Q6K5_IXOPE|nr:hypothetical protein HPB47_024460 [Ixodes persulcatus]
MVVREGRISDAHRSGRPRRTGEEENWVIEATAVADPFMSAQEIREELDPSLSCDTIQHRLKEAGLKNCVAAQKPHLTDSGGHGRRAAGCGCSVVFVHQNLFETKSGAALRRRRLGDSIASCPR